MNSNGVKVHLKKVFEEKGTSQRKTARALGMQPTQLSKIANAKREPRVGLALRLARVLDCSVEEIFSIDDEAA